MVEERREGMERLIEKEKTYLWSRALQIARKTEDAEDLLQETLLKACEGFNSFTAETNFRAWSKRIMINAHINKIKRKKGETLPLDDSYQSKHIISLNGAQLVSCMDSPDIVFFHNHISEKIMERYYSLPEIYRLPFSMFHFNGYTYSEISSAMNIPSGTVKSRIHRAKALMTEIMRDGKCH
jgi:RNA polymerase sigma-70 factor (ECF subfamily)